MTEAILTRAAIRPDAKEGRHSGTQKRVEQTVEFAYQALTGKKIPERKINTKKQGENTIEREVTAVRMSKLLSQGILGGGRKFPEVYKDEFAKLKEQGVGPIEQRDIAMEDYLKGKIIGGDPLKDIRNTVDFFRRSIERLYMPFVSEVGENNADKTVTFTAVRHGDKSDEGNLTEVGEKEARDAGESMKGLENLKGIFGVQHPQNQMMMMACIAGKMIGEDENIFDQEINIPLTVWDKMPEAWQVPYKTGEVSSYTLALLDDFNKENFAGMEENEKNDYLKHIRLTIERNNHKENFSLADIYNYLSL